MINANIGRDRPFDAYSIQILPPIEDWQRVAKQIDVQVGGYCYLLSLPGHSVYFTISCGIEFEADTP